MEKLYIPPSKASHTPPPNRMDSGNIEVQMACLWSINVSAPFKYPP